MHEMIDDLHELCGYLENELATTNEKIRKSGGELSGSDLEYVDKLTHALKSIKTTVAMVEAGDDYSYRGGMSYARGNNRGRTSDARGRTGNNVRRDSMGRYSRNDGGYSYDDGMDDVIEQLEDVMESAPSEHIKKKVKRLISEIESAS